MANFISFAWIRGWVTVRIWVRVNVTVRVNKVLGLRTGVRVIILGLELWTCG